MKAGICRRLFVSRVFGRLLPVGLAVVRAALLVAGPDRDVDVAAAKALLAGGGPLAGLCLRQPRFSSLPQLLGLATVRVPPKIKTHN